MTTGEAWTYWRLYASPDELDRAALELSSIVQGVEETSVRWFFIRYTDAGGPHIRFRIRTSPDGADRLFLLRRSITYRIEADLYEPETAKWGTGRSLEAAESAFQASSEFALSALSADADRLRVAYRVMLESVFRLVPEPEVRARMLETHATWWLSGNGPGSPLYGEALRESRLPAHGDAGEPSGLGGLDRVVAAFGAALDAADDSHVPLYHLHQHLHLTMNRLGLGARQEALVALRTRASLTDGKERRE